MKIIHLFLLFIPFISYTQEVTEGSFDSNGFIEFNSSLGFSTITLKDNFKTNASIVEGVLSKEVLISKRFSIVPGIGILKINTDFIDIEGNQSHLTNDLIIIPFNLRYNTSTISDFMPYFEAGVYGSYLFKSVVEIERINKNDKENKLGGSIGLQATIGIQQIINEKFFFRLSFNTKGDIIQFNKNSKPNFKINELYALQLGFGIRK
jgi:hypothetical protein